MSSGIASDPTPVSRAPQRQRGRDRVAALLAAAALLFVEKGYDATTMTEIAAHAGASIGSLYLFFPTKQALAHAMLTELGDEMSARLTRLRMRIAGATAARIADALFGELSLFMAAHPVYAVLLDVPGEHDWRRVVRNRRRSELAELFTAADPPLPPGQSDRLALIVPQLMRITMTLSGEAPPLRDALLKELRDMLRHHLEAETPRD